MFGSRVHESCKSRWRLAPIVAIVAIVAAQSAHTARAAVETDVVKVQIVASDMCCQGCAQTIAAQLYTLPGIKSVDANVETRTLVITAKPSAKLTLERIWQAVEQGKGGPTKIAGAQAIYSWIRSENLRPEQKLTTGQYYVRVRNMSDKEAAQKIAHQLYAVRGVKGVSVDISQRALFIDPADAAPLSPWALAAAVELAADAPLAIGGPNGLMTIEWPNDAKPATAARTGQSLTVGGVR